MALAQPGGSRLPAWVQFDPRSGSFQVNAPAGFSGVLEIRVTARDQQGQEASAVFKLYIGTQKPAGRAGLSEQIRMSAQRIAPFADLARSAAVAEKAAASRPLPGRA